MVKKGTGTNKITRKGSHLHFKAKTVSTSFSFQHTAVRMMHLLYVKLLIRNVLPLAFIIMIIMIMLMILMIIMMIIIVILSCLIPITPRTGPGTDLVRQLITSYLFKRGDRVGYTQSTLLPQQLLSRAVTYPKGSFIA